MVQLFKTITDHQRLATVIAAVPNVSCDSATPMYLPAPTSVPDLVPMVNACELPAPGIEPTFAARVRNMGGQPYVGQTTASFALTGQSNALKPSDPINDPFPFQVSGTGWSCVSNVCKTQNSVAPGTELPFLRLSVVGRLPTDRQFRTVIMTISTSTSERSQNNQTLTRIGVVSDGATGFIGMNNGFGGPGLVGGTVDGQLSVRFPVGKSLPVTGFSVYITSFFAEHFVGPSRTSGWTCNTSFFPAQSVIPQSSSLECRLNVPLPVDGQLPPIRFKFKPVQSTQGSTVFLALIGDSSLFSDFQFGLAA